MADIVPFRGIRYDTGKAGAPLDLLLAPPYDVISPAEQDSLYARHERNVIRLILGREEDKYERAASLFKEWLASGVLTADADPALYVYHQTFFDPVTGEPCPDRVGLICLLKLEEYSSGKVLPHENTLTAAKADRLNLLKATNAQFESIYGLYSDPDRAVQSFLAEYDDRETVIERVDGLIGSTHRIEKIDAPDAIGVIQELLRDKAIFIADGHHRYETSLNYRRQVRETVTDPRPIPADYILITLTAFEDPGLLVLPTHRMVSGADPAAVGNLSSLLSANFHVAPAPAERLEESILQSQERGGIAIGVVCPGGEGLLATLNASVDRIPELIGGPESLATKKLDVSILHHLILKDLLGISLESLAAGKQVRYTRDTKEAIDAARNGAAQVSFLLGRPSVTDVRDVSLAGDKMPQKSTYFFPKLLSGLVMRDLNLD